jgi:hypothetical protein
MIVHGDYNAVTHYGDVEFLFHILRDRIMWYVQ